MELELVVNAWYKEWLKTNDLYQSNFETELETLLPNLKFTLDIPSNTYFLIGNL